MRTKTSRALGWTAVAAAASGLGLAGCSLFVGAEGPIAAGVYEGPAEPGYVAVPEAPPPVVIEHPPSPPPGPYVWIGGYWHWNGRYVWERGHWAMPPREHAAWVAPRYERHGQGYRYAPGHWRAEPPGRGREGREGHR